MPSVALLVVPNTPLAGYPPRPTCFMNPPIHLPSESRNRPRSSLPNCTIHRIISIELYPSRRRRPPSNENLVHSPFDVLRLGLSKILGPVNASPYKDPALVPSLEDPSISLLSQPPKNLREQNALGGV